MKKRAIAAALLLAAFSTGALAEPVTFKADLTGAQEVPATDSKGTGTAVVTYDPEAKLLKWTVTYSGLSGPATMAHIHGPAEPGKNASVVIAFANPESPIEGSATLTDAQAAELTAGKLYVNVHTADHKSGEIRGQLTAAK